MLILKMRGILAFFIMLVMCATMSVSIATTAQAAEPPPEPVTVDRSGCDQDGFIIDESTSEPATRSYYFVENDPSTEADDVELLAGHNVAGCVSPFRLKTYYADDEGYILEGPNFELTFESTVFGKEALDTYAAEVLVDTCDYISTKTQVRFWYTNEPDETLRFVDEVTLGTLRVGDEMNSAFLPQDMILDGETREMGIQYMRSGWHRIHVWYDDGYRKLMFKRKIYVPPCGGYMGTMNPRGTLKQVAPHRVKARVFSGTSRTATFRLVENPKKGKTVVSTFTTKSGGAATRFERGMFGTRFVLKLKVETASGVKWRTLQRMTLRR